MSEYALTTHEQKQLALPHAHFTPGGGISTPFARDIFLLETHVAGTMHGAARRIEPSLMPGAPLVLRREPDNPYDEHAIIFLTEAGEDPDRLGEVRQSRVAIVAESPFGLRQKRPVVGEVLACEKPDFTDLTVFIREILAAGRTGVFTRRCHENHERISRIGPDRSERSHHRGNRGVFGFQHVIHSCGQRMRSKRSLLIRFG